MTNKMPEVEEALEWLKKVLDKSMELDIKAKPIISLEGAAQNLIDALEAEKAIQNELPEDNSQKEPEPFEFKPDTSFKFTAPRKVYRVDLSSLYGIESLTWYAPADGLYTINGKEIRLKAGDPIKSAKYSVEPDNQEEPIWVLGSASTSLMGEFNIPEKGGEEKDLKTILKEQFKKGFETGYNTGIAKAELDKFNSKKQVEEEKKSEDITKEESDAWNKFCNFAPLSEESDKPKSIWKDVSELPEDFEDGIIETYASLLNISGRYSIGQINKKGFYGFGGLTNEPDIKRFCFLADFINSFEQLQNKVEEMERKIKEK